MQLQKRPKLNIPRSKMETLLDIICLLIIIGNVIYIIKMYPSLPNRIPIHFNGNDVADGWGNKAFVWILPLITLIIWGGMTILEKFPHLYNYSNLTERNIEGQYKNARLMVHIIKAEITIFLAYNSWSWIYSILGTRVGFGIWELLIFIIIMIGTIVFMALRSARIK
ncbi:DUF1648 domain-containing protein [Margalitia sp. FSL K6-0131]|uniref:DUF1648 domain-containing protein n=1 Tax=Margalitia sp. FSL K6-0131 TaxID=2954604 RepID=UPI0030F7EC9A